MVSDQTAFDPPGLRHLLEAVRAPGTPGELGGEQAMVAALAAERRRAALTARPRGRLQPYVRKIVVIVATGLALLTAGGTAVAAATGSLPHGVQQRAHGLFSALGVPAPGTGPSPAPAATRGSAAPELQAAWCTAWTAAEAGGKPMNGRDRRDLITAAGGPERVTPYCAALVASASPAAAGKPGRGPSRRATPAHPNPAHPTPAHPTPSHPVPHGRSK